MALQLLNPGEVFPLNRCTPVHTAGAASARSVHAPEVVEDSSNEDEDMEELQRRRRPSSDEESDSDSEEDLDDEEIVKKREMLRQRALAKVKKEEVGTVVQQVSRS